MATHEPQIVAIGGGKGGVGKSLLTANLGIFLATLGKRVVVIDAALGMPNLHLFCGVPRPSRTLGECLGAGEVPLAELAVATPVPGLRLVAGAADPAWVADAGVAVAHNLLTAARRLDCDWVVLDLAPGTASDTLELFLGADVGIIAAVPDPTSVELMHRFVRTSFLHRLRQLGLGELLERPISPRGRDAGMPGPLELYLAAVERGDPFIDHLREAILGFQPQLVINAARSKHDMELGRAIASAARRRLGVPMSYLGHLEYDEAVWASTRRRRPLLVEHPEARIAKCIEKVTRGVLALRSAMELDIDVLPSDSHYDLLEVAPSASFEDIRRANRRIRDVYGAESIAIAGLYDPAGLEAVHRRLDLSYTTLMDAAKRKEYDQELFPDGIPMPVAPAPTAPGEAILNRAERVEVPVALRPPMPELGPRTEYTGALLRQMREALGIELREVAERSKIGMGYLSALESDGFARLPAPVYVRGFLGEYARILGLDPERVKDSYLERYRGGRIPPADAVRDDAARKRARPEAES